MVACSHCPWLPLKLQALTLSSTKPFWWWATKLASHLCPCRGEAGWPYGVPRCQLLLELLVQMAHSITSPCMAAVQH
jgi:hypothetical protein